MGDAVVPIQSWATAASTPLPAPTEFVSFATGEVWPELARWFLFAGGVLVVVAVIKRLTGR